MPITLVVGILVDDAIVEIENIVRHIRMGGIGYDASMQAANEIGLTVVAISLTIVAVFAPVGVMPGIVGKVFREFGLTVAVAVLFSLLVARLITPMFAAYFMRSKPGGDAADRFGDFRRIAVFGNLAADRIRAAFGWRAGHRLGRAATGRDHGRA